MKHFINQLVVIKLGDDRIITTINSLDDERVYTGTVVKNRQVVHTESVLQRDKVGIIDLANQAETNLFFDTLYLHYLDKISE